MKRKTTLIIFVCSLVFSAWLYWGSDIKLEQKLTSHEWQTSIELYISPEKQKETREQLHMLEKIEVTSNVKYLPNGTYLRISSISLYDKEEKKPSVMTISEKGRWELSANYLIINPSEFKETLTNRNLAIEDKQMELIKTFFIIDSEQSRRVDIINNKSILLTSLNHGSRLLSSN